MSHSNRRASGLRAILWASLFGPAFLSTLVLFFSVMKGWTQNSPTLRVRSANGPAELTLEGLPGTTNQLQYADGLQDAIAWQSLTNVIIVSNPASFLDTAAALSAHRFYRTEMIGGGETAGVLEMALATGLAQAQAGLDPDPLDFDLAVSQSTWEQRAPVLVWSGHQWEDRHFLDLNGNGQFEESSGANPGGRGGDPQWIGVLRDPGQPHGRDNPFVARYAYLVLPAGKTLDLNTLGNNGAINPNLRANRDAFLRNQGFGPWELNLAAFLADLNPNQWGGLNYQYRPGSLSSGAAFDDARDLLRFRYQWSLGAIGNNPASVRDLFGILGEAAFATDQVDGYAYGPLATTGYALPGLDSDLPTDPWPGAPGRTNFILPQDLLNQRITSTNFTQRLLAAGAQTSAFDRYTFYRLLAQLGTDTTPVQEDRLHLNYVNIGGLRETNFQSWWVDSTTSPGLDPALVELTNKIFAVRFFTNLAQRIYADQIHEFSPDPATGLIISNITMIPVWPVNLYSPGIHRILQEAANIYDATRADRLPTVFRPLIRGIGGTNYMVGYTNDASVATLAAYLATANTNGLPVVIGAKKGLPNFNEYTLHTDFTLARKLEVVYQGRQALLQFQTNQMYLLGISNLFGFELWNSYTNTYPYPLTVQMMNHTTVILSNQYGANLNSSFDLLLSPTTIPANAWSGTGASPFNYLVPARNTVVLLTNSVWSARNNTLTPAASNGADAFERNLPAPFMLPQWQLMLSNNFTYVLSEGDRIVDFVWLTQLQSATDLLREMMAPSEVEQSAGQLAGCWDTNRVDNSFDETVPTQGILNQIEISMIGDEIDVTLWNNWNEGPAQSHSSRDAAVERFRRFLLLQDTNMVAGSNMQAPFSALRRMSQTVSWQANDPLVHYHIADLMLWPTNSDFIFVIPPQGGQASNSALASLGRMNVSFWPWGGNPERAGTAIDPMSFDRSIKDPGIRESDDWDFPAGKFASIGWLGRVHRGTPWQTVYFKPEVPAPQNWLYQSHDMRTVPTNDWCLADLCTIATYEQATRGLLSINQTNLAAWSAVLAGTLVVTNYLDDDALVSLLLGTAGSHDIRGANLTNLVIQPASSYPSADPASNPILRIHAGMLAARARQPGGHFTRLSQLLQVPEFTVASPFLNQTDLQMQFGLNDLAYEMLPTRLLSLLKVGDARAVIQTWAQVLAPGGADAATGTPTNYQVMAEAAARTVK